MGVPISIRLDDDIRDELEAQAHARGVGLSTLLRELATKAARDARRARIREASAEVGRQVQTGIAPFPWTVCGLADYGLAATSCMSAS